jgi:hypothetical protein
MDPRTNYAAMLEARKRPPKNSEPSSALLLGRGMVDYAKGLANVPRGVMTGEIPVWDPETGHVNPDLVDWSGNIALSTAGAGAMGAPEEALTAGGGSRIKVPPKGKKAPAEDVFDPEARLRSREGFTAEEVPAGEERPDQLFDLSRDTLEKRPDRPQFDLPRYDPPRGISMRLIDMMADPRVREELMRYAEQGAEKGAKGWYNLQQLREQFIRELGPDQGDQGFRRFVDMMSATSPRSKLPANVKNASQYYHLSMGGEELKPGSNMPPPKWIPPEDYKPVKGSGYGHLAQNLHRDNVREALSPEGWDVFEHPKPPSYGENLYGNWRPATIDAHAIKLPSMIYGDERFLKGSMAFKGKNGEKIYLNPAKDFKEGRLTLEDAQKKAINWEDQPRPNEYPAMERYYQDIAEEMGMDPAQFQASVWVGGGKRTGLGSDENKSALEFFADGVINTAKKRGVPPRQIMRDFIRGKIPLMSTAGGAITLDQLSDAQRKSLGVPSAAEAPPRGDWAAGLKEGEAY